jgi:hypothetical protein
VYERSDSDHGPGLDAGSVEHGRTRRHVGRRFDLTAEKGGLRADERMVADDHRVLLVTHRCRSENGLLADDRALSDLDTGTLGIENRARHDRRPGPTVTRPISSALAAT